MPLAFRLRHEGRQLWSPAFHLIVIQEAIRYAVFREMDVRRIGPLLER
jgi:hypothetical protein